MCLTKVFIVMSDRIHYLYLYTPFFAEARGGCKTLYRMSELDRLLSRFKIDIKLSSVDSIHSVLHSFTLVDSGISVLVKLTFS